MSFCIKDSFIENATKSYDIALNSDTYHQLAEQVEYRLHEIIQDAKKFMIHSKRECLKVQDISKALKLRRTDALYGYNTVSKITFQTDNKNPEKVILNNPIINLDDILKTPMPSYPSEITFHMHWLDVEGVQPRIPENPTAQVLQSQAESKGDNSVAIQPEVSHALSNELMLYFQKVKEGIHSEDSQIRETIYNSLRRDRGFHQLLPYLIQYIISEMKMAIKLKRENMLQNMFSLLYVCESIIHNPNINIHFYLHQLIPPILSCLLAKTLSQSPVEDHWKLREKAALILADICNTFATPYPNLQQRLIVNITTILKKPTNLCALYGVIVCLQAFGPTVISSILIPIYPKLVTMLEKVMKEGTPIKQYQAQKCYIALNQAVGIFIMNQYNILNGLPSTIKLDEVKQSINELPPSNTISNLSFMFPYSTQPTSSFYTLSGSLFYSLVLFNINDYWIRI